MIQVSYSFLLGIKKYRTNKNKFTKGFVLNLNLNYKKGKSNAPKV